MENISYPELIKSLSKISKAITSELYLEDILRLIVTVTAEVMGSKICSLMLIDEEHQELVIRATQSISEEYVKKSPLKIGEGIAGKVAKDNKPRTVLDVTHELEYKYQDMAKREGLCSLACIPLSVKGKVIGVINCYTATPHEFTNEELELLTIVANQSAIIIENTELIVKTRVIQEELEIRKRLERAKGILIKEEGLTEEEAYLKIQHYATAKRISIREVSEAIILTYEMKKQR